MISIPISTASFTVKSLSEVRSANKIHQTQSIIMRCFDPALLAGSRRPPHVGFHARTRRRPVTPRPNSRGALFSISSNVGGTGSAGSPAVAPPSRQQLRVLALRAAIPMVGFGMMDNLVMIQAGAAIDANLSVVFGFSTLTAAGFGQIVSDVAGLTSGGLVDMAVSKLNLPHHNLTAAQLGLRECRLYHTLGGCVGVVIGCLLGMSCLLFMDTDKADRMRKAKALQSIFESVMDEGHKLVHADRATLWMLDDERGELWSRVATGAEGTTIKVPSRVGIAGYCAMSGTIVNVPDAYQDARFHRDVDAATGYHTTSVLAVPVKEGGGKVIGVIQMINKTTKDDEGAAFDASDEKLVQVLASHVSSFIRIVNE